VWLLVVLLVASCGSSGQKPPRVVVASADSPEQLVLGKMTVLALKAAGHGVTDKTGLGSDWMVRAALEAGNIDICWQYAGETWASHLGHDQPIAQSEELYEKVRQEDTQRGITWLPVAPCQRTLVLLMRETVAREREITSISDLLDHMEWVEPQLSLCAPEELYGAVGGIRGLQRFYGLRFDESQVHLMPVAKGYQALMKGDCNCTVGFSTDGQIASDNLRSLDDDLGFFQRSNLAVAVRTSVLQECPSLSSTLGQIAGLLTQEAIIELNRQVVVEGDKPEAVAKRFLTLHGVIGQWPAAKGQ